MKKLIPFSLAVIVMLMVSCHTKKKLVETHSLVDKTITKTADSSSVKTTVTATKADSSKTTRADSSISIKKEKIDILFHLRSGKSLVLNRDSVGDGTNDYMNDLINHALADADSVSVHIEREQKDTKHATSTEQKAVKETATGHQEAKHAASTDQKKDITEKSKTKSVETKPDYGWIPWALAIVAVMGACLWIMHKLKV